MKKSRFMSIDANQEEMLMKELNRLCRNTNLEIKSGIRKVKSEIKSNRYDRATPLAKAALMKYNVTITSTGKRLEECIYGAGSNNNNIRIQTSTEQCLSRQKALISASEKVNKENSSKNGHDEFVTFISDLLKKVDKVCDSHRKKQIL